jgi:CRISPR/Cas system-associated exonuclease Cas4 (RecB family)
VSLNLPKGHLSPSQLSSFEKCPKQYEIFTVNGARRPPDFFLEAHRQTHDTILEFDLRYKAEHGKNRGDSELSEHYRAKMEESLPLLREAHDLEGKTAEKAVEEEVAYFDKIITASRPFRAATVPAKSPEGVARIEERLEFNMGSVPVVAYLDLVADREIFDQVLDLKRRGKTPRAGLAAKSVQLATYSAGTGLSDVGLRTIVENVKPVIHVDDGTMTQGRIARVVTKYEDTAHRISSGLFPPVDDGDPMKEWICSAKWCGAWSKDSTDWLSGKSIACEFGQRAAESVAVGG